MERLLRITDVAAMLSTTEGVAASILSQAGIQPVDFGMGRSRGRRWLESAVCGVIRSLHEKAQPAKRTSRRRTMPYIGMENKSTSELHSLTSGRPVQ